MASDEEIAQHVAQAERTAGGCGSNGSPAAAELDEYKRVAGEIHDELARRIDAVDQRAVDEASLSTVVDRLDRLDARLDELEERV